MGRAFKILRVNLSRLCFHVTERKIIEVADVLGAMGVATNILLEEVKRESDPLGPENKLMLAPGALTGSAVVGAVKSAVISKSPLTEIYGESIFSADCGIHLKRAGYDLLVIEGRAEKPVYLFIQKGNVEFKDASNLWGMETFEAFEAIRRDLNERNVGVMGIGPAGERLVRLASIISDNGRAAARCGLGAVMGSKNLKAIACKGDNEIEAVDATSFEKVASEIKEHLMRRLDRLSRFRMLGTSGGVLIHEVEEGLPTKNWSRGSFPGAEKISGERIAEKFLVGRRTCFGCPMACQGVVELKDGPYAPLKAKRPEYESIAALGSLCMNDNLESIIKAADLCDRLGLDTISTGTVIAFAMECYGRGLLTKNETGGLEIKFGDHEVMIKLIEQIGRREGFGAILGEGVKRAAERIGRGAERFAMHVKGLELPMHSPYRYKELGLQYAVSERGACHLRGLSFLPAWGMLLPEVGIDKVVDGFSIEGKARICKILQDVCRVWDALGMCKHVVTFGGIPLTKLAALYSALVGVEFELEDLVRAGERVWILQRAFNVKMGIRRKDDTLPKRFLEEPLPDGVARGQIVELEPMLKEYYELRGLDEDGKPRIEKLKELGIEHVISLI